jgi:hypothetical protein
MISWSSVSHSEVESWISVMTRVVSGPEGARTCMGSVWGERGPMQHPELLSLWHLGKAPEPATAAVVGGKESFVSPCHRTSLTGTAATWQPLEQAGCQLRGMHNAISSLTHLAQEQ